MHDITRLRAFRAPVSAATLALGLLAPLASLAAQGATGTRADTTRADSVRARTPQTLARVDVRARAKRTGYAAVRTTTAMRTETPLRDTPQSVSIVTRELIADQAMRGMADVVRYIPGITMGQGEGHRDAPTIRGISTTADFYVDGVRDDVQYYRDLYNVDRVEALKGSNAMIFGRGGGGGVINRATKTAEWAPTRTLTLDGGSFDQRRGALDLGGGMTERVAVRLNAMGEDSRMFRDGVGFQRWGVNPTATIAAGLNTTVRLGYERFDDRRVVDRGIPSANGIPSSAPIARYFGDRNASHSRLAANVGTAVVEHQAGRVLLRNRSQAAGYDKFYQNVFPSSAVSNGRVNLGAYNAGTDRTNLFNQTEATFKAATGHVGHTVLVGTEFGSQRTRSTRETGYFGSATSTAVAFDAPVLTTPVTFRQSQSDANARATLSIASAYLQDQIAVAPWLQLVGGVRVERFDLRFHDLGNPTPNAQGQPLRAAGTLARRDNLVSPRLGAVVKPVESVSLYASSSVSFLPSSGDQFSSLTATTQNLRPERFRNEEVGAKWELARGLALTAAAFRLDRDNTLSPAPASTGLLVQTGRQRTTGWELGATGTVLPRWEVAAGFGTQVARITDSTSAAPAGRRVPLVPRTQWSLWNKVGVTKAASVGLGVIRQGDMYAAIDNTVRLPAFTRVDAALYYTLTRNLRAQLNVENVLDETYYATSHGNNNIMPGTPRLVRLTLVTGR